MMVDSMCTNKVRTSIFALILLSGCVFIDLDPRHHDWIGFFHATCDTSGFASADILLGKWTGDDGDDNILEFKRGNTGDLYGGSIRKIPKYASDPDSSVRRHAEKGASEISSYHLCFASDSTALLLADVLPFKIGSYILADIAPYELNLERGLLASLYSIPSHTIWRIEVLVDTLYLSSLSGRWLWEALLNDPNLLVHEVNTHGNILVTAPTDRIQEFLISNESSLEFTDSEPWYRIRE